MKRYDFHTEYGHGEMLECKDGEYVRYDDFVERLVLEIKLKWEAQDSVACLKRQIEDMLTE